MPNLGKGHVIGIPCTVNPGPFSGEKLVTLETIDGALSGFVKDEDLCQLRGDEQWFVRALVLSTNENDVEVKIRGSFFTTNGFATVSRGADLIAA